MCATGDSCQLGQKSFTFNTVLFSACVLHLTLYTVIGSSHTVKSEFVSWSIMLVATVIVYSVELRSKTLLQNLRYDIFLNNLVENVYSFKVYFSFVFSAFLRFHQNSMVVSHL